MISSGTMRGSLHAGMLSLLDEAGFKLGPIVSCCAVGDDLYIRVQGVLSCGEGAHCMSWHTCHNQEAGFFPTKRGGPWAHICSQRDRD
jgi:hypothetical protein